jgi:hypothetical protein
LTRRTTIAPAVAAAAFGFALLAARPAAAQLQTCVEIQGKTDAAALDRLVRGEIDRHPTHRAAATDCQGYLIVEVIDLGPRPEEGKWVTGRINGQVPHREKVGPDGLGPAVERLLKVVLHNDPLVLHGPESPGWLQRQRRALERRSRTHFGAEVYELTAPLGSSVATLSGLGLTVRREIDALYVGVRVGAAVDPVEHPMSLRLHAQVDAQVEAALYLSPIAETSLFASALVGLSYQRFDGPASFDGPGATGTATSTGVALALRGGVETLRTSDVRLVAFLQLQAPGFISRDPDHGVVERWIPCLTIGAGALF